MPTFPTSFSDFLISTKVHKVTGYRDILHEAQKRTYWIRDMMADRDPGLIVKGGQSIKDTVKFTTTGSFQFYQPNATFNPQNTDHQVDVTVGWRFAVSHYGWTDEEIALNGDAADEDRFVDLKYSKEQDCAIDHWNGMEASLWQVPVATMETASGNSPPWFSIPGIVNEATSGLWPSVLTTVHSVNPSTYAGWVPQQQTYDSLNPFSDTAGIVPAFDEMWHLVKFESPDPGSPYFKTPRMRRQKIATNRKGIVKYKQALRALNDQLRQGPQDPEYNNPEYAGIPLRYVSELDTSALEITSQTTATGSAYPATKPRYFWLNLEHLYLIFNKARFMEPVGPKDGGAEQPFVGAMFKRTWGALFCRSRQRQGIVYPA